MLCGLFAASFTFSNLAAQDSLTVIGKFIEGHSWTMDFRIESNLTLSTFQGTAISLSKFVSDYQRIRFGIGTSVNSSSSGNSGMNYSADTLSGRSSGNSENESYSVQISLQRLTYGTPDAQTSIFFGIGPFGGMSWSKNSSSNSSTSVGSYQNQQSNSSTNKTYSAGVLGSFGVEWFFSEHISLHAEYGLAASYSWGSGESSNSYQSGYPGSSNPSIKNISSNSGSGWSLSGQSVLFGLSVNF